MENYCNWKLKSLFLKFQFLQGRKSNPSPSPTTSSWHKVSEIHHCYCYAQSSAIPESVCMHFLVLPPYELHYFVFVCAVCTPASPFQHLSAFQNSILPPDHSPTTNPLPPRKVRVKLSPRRLSKLNFLWREAVLGRNYLLVPWFLFPLFYHLKLLLYKNLILVSPWRQFAPAINSSR